MQYTGQQRKMKKFGIPAVFAAAFVSLAAVPEFQVSVLVPDGEPGKSHLEEEARLFASRLSRTLKREAAFVPFGKAEAKTIFLLTREAGADKVFSAPLQGKNKDSFIIRYPVTVRGKKNVCLLMCRDRYGYPYPGSCFLRRFLGVDQVGPGEKLGWVYPDNSRWKMPEKIDVVEIPDFNTRTWTTSRPANIDLAFYLAASRRNIAWHSFGTIIPPEKYGKSHPEFYPLIRGRRFIPTNPYAGWQPCVSNGAFQARCVEYLLENDGKDGGDGPTFGINDGAGNCCECPNCRAMDDPVFPGDYSKRFFTFYKQVLDKARQKRPGLKARIMLYGANTNRIPLDVPIHPGLIGMGMNYTDFPGFLKHGLKHAGLWDHQMDTRYPTVRHYPKFLSSRLKKLYGLGLREYFSEMYPIHAGSAPKQYILARILWNVNADPDRTMTEYCTKAFGAEAAPHVKAYFDVWELVYEREKDDLKADVNVPVYGVEKFIGLRSGDTRKMASALERAAKCAMTAEERRRLEIVADYFGYLRCLADRFLLAKGLREEKKITVAGIDEVVRKCGELDRRFEETARKIASSGEDLCWFFNVDAKKRKIDLDKDLIFKRYRDVVSTYIMESMDIALKNAEAVSCKGMSRQEKLAYWKGMAKKYPAVIGIAFRIAANSGTAVKNFIKNGDFKKGEPGDPEVRGAHPHLDHWYFYEQVGRARSDDFKSFWNWTRVKGGWSDNLCFGNGKYPEVRQYMYLPAGIYRLSARRSGGGGVMNFSLYEAGNFKEEFLSDTEKLRAMRFTGLRFSYNHRSGRGKENISQLVTVSKSGYYALLIAVPDHTSKRYTRLMDVRLDQLVAF